MRCGVVWYYIDGGWLLLLLLRGDVGCARDVT